MLSIKSEIKRALDHAPSQGEYNRLVSFENRDLQLRELKHEALRLFQEVLAQNPPLADQAPYNPQEAFQDFLSEHGDQLDRLHWDVSERDKLELQFLALVKQGGKAKPRGGRRYYTRKKCFSWRSEEAQTSFISCLETMIDHSTAGKTIIAGKGGSYRWLATHFFQLKRRKLLFSLLGQSKSCRTRSSTRLDRGKLTIYLLKIKKEWRRKASEKRLGRDTSLRSYQSQTNHLVCNVREHPQAPLLRALGGRALTSAFLSLGLPGGLALALGAVAKVLCHFDDVSGVLSGPLRMMPAGSDSAGNASSGSWEKYLNLPSDSEGQGQGIEEEPASRKRDRDADPIADAGPSSSQRVNPAAGPSRQVGQPLSEEEQRLALLGPDQLSQWVTARQFQIEDQINLLRKSEGMRPLGALRGEQVLIHFETVYGIGALETVLKDMQENGRESSFYQ
ncbi:hypothetical protein E3N88_18715 [Mikania micrantha]|uniref:Uncharacterized protein n=1 Tax=Mikania micrantha TaxID=192012 RepID=A0A5N6NMM5_9ASTR|nr:hypothetical protein E3N88_18715 [Mikania micrantha]